ERLEQLGALPVGGAVITPGGDLPASFLIHVVTSSDDEPESVASVEKALRNGLRRAAEWGLRSLAVPGLGTGVGTMDHEEAARTVVEVVRDHLAEGQPPLEITIVVRGEYEADVFGQVVGDLGADRAAARGGGRGA
ncbi:MAG TPA: macro domain-containing protein, partial [Longimicrobiales bacterium]|nr:macro domain-containing protein [Longimicrobiales bacterium]